MGRGLTAEPLPELKLSSRILFGNIRYNCWLKLSTLKQKIYATRPRFRRLMTRPFSYFSSSFVPLTPNTARPLPAFGRWFAASVWFNRNSTDWQLYQALLTHHQRQPSRFADADQITSTTGRTELASWKKFPQRESRLVLRDIDFTVTCHTFVFSAKNCNWRPNSGKLETSDRPNGGKTRVKNRKP